MQPLHFAHFRITGEAASQFLQGQITADTAKITQDYQLTAICNLKGRVDFGLWLAKTPDEQGFSVVVAADCADALLAHIKKYGAFSKISVSAPTPITTHITADNQASFTENISDNSSDDTGDNTAWLTQSIANGQTVITTETRGLFQPQELRLHQLGYAGGVHYDKGCYLGQEVVARLWFKAAPKAWLHRVAGEGTVPAVADTLESRHIKVVNAVAVASGFAALVVARPEALAESSLQILDLPKALSESVAKT